MFPSACSSGERPKTIWSLLFHCISSLQFIYSFCHFPGPDWQDKLLLFSMFHIVPCCPRMPTETWHQWCAMLLITSGYPRKPLSVKTPKSSRIEELTSLKFTLDDSSLSISHYHQGNRYSLATRAPSSTLNAEAWVSDRGCPSAPLQHSYSLYLWLIHR